MIVSCASMDEADLSARLFGPMENGEAQPLLEEARGGTLVLEDIDALPKALQARLLTWINDQGTPAETRIVALATFRSRAKAAKTCCVQTFTTASPQCRSRLPPLRHAAKTILTLFTRFSEQFSEEYGCDAPEVSAQEAAQLLQAPWPGNVRQLINVAERAVLQNRRGSGTIASAADGRERRYANRR